MLYRVSQYEHAPFSLGSVCSIYPVTVDCNNLAFSSMLSELYCGLRWYSTALLWLLFWSMVSRDVSVQFHIVIILYDLLLVMILHSDRLFVLELIACSLCRYILWDHAITLCIEIYNLEMAVNSRPLKSLCMKIIADLCLCRLFDMFEMTWLMVVSWWDLANPEGWFTTP